MPYVYEFPEVPSWLADTPLWEWWTGLDLVTRHYAVGQVWFVSGLCFCIAAATLNKRRNGNWRTRGVYFLFLLMANCTLGGMADTGVKWAYDGILICFAMIVLCCVEYLAWRHYQRNPPVLLQVRPPIPRAARESGIAHVASAIRRSAGQ